MSSLRLIVLMSSVGLMILGADGASSQTYPSKPIRMIAGEAGDTIVARQIAQAIAVPLGQPVIIDERPSNLSPDILAKATPDGYTLLLVGGNLWLTPLIQKTPYDPVKDISPVTLVSKYPLVVIVNPSVPANSVKELIALAKAKPAGLNYGRGTLGGSAHLGTELFKSMAGVNLVEIPYKGTAAAVNALIAGEVQVMINNLAGAVPFIKSGKLRALAVTSPDPSPLAAGLPTVAATLPGYEFEGLLGIFTTAGTPTVVVQRLNQEIVRFLRRPEVKEQFFNAGSEVVGSSPEELSGKIKAEMVRMGKVIKDAGIHID